MGQLNECEVDPVCGCDCITDVFCGESAYSGSVDIWSNQECCDLCKADPNCASWDRLDLFGQITICRLFDSPCERLPGDLYSGGDKRELFESCICEDGTCGKKIEIECGDPSPKKNKKSTNDGYRRRRRRLYDEETTAGTRSKPERNCDSCYKCKCNESTCPDGDAWAPQPEAVPLQGITMEDVTAEQIDVALEALDAINIEATTAKFDDAVAEFRERLENLRSTAITEMDDKPQRFGAAAVDISQSELFKDDLDYNAASNAQETLTLSLSPSVSIVAIFVILIIAICVFLRLYKPRKKIVNESEI